VRSAASDPYSLGVVAWECLAGAPPSPSEWRPPVRPAPMSVPGVQRRYR